MRSVTFMSLSVPLDAPHGATYTWEHSEQSPAVRRTEMTAATVAFKGNPVTLGGDELTAGQRAPQFSAIDTSLQPVRVSDARGKVLILSAVPSLDTPVCDTET